MDTQKPKIVFYRKRQLGEKLNAAIDFMKENWRVLFKMLVYIILPLSLIQGFSYSRSITKIISESWYAGTASASVGESLLNLLIGLGTLYLTAMIYTLMKRYNEREERLAGVTFAEIMPQVNKGAGRILLFGVSTIPVVIVFIFLMVGIAIISPDLIYSPLFLLLLVWGVMTIFVPLLLASPIYLFEKNITLPEVWKQTFRLGYATWGGTFMLALISGILIFVCTLVVALPLIIFSVIQNLLSLSVTASSGESILYGLLQYLLSVLVAFFSYVTSVFFYVVMAYQYAHAREVTDHVALEGEIDQFDALGSSDE